MHLLSFIVLALGLIPEFSSGNTKQSNLHNWMFEKVLCHHLLLHCEQLHLIKVGQSQLFVFELDMLVSR
jgi:hypothetical protein